MREAMNALPSWPNAEDVQPMTDVHKGSRLLALERAQCCICEATDAEPVAVGEDFEYRTSDDSFLAVQCQRCGLVYLDPRPTADELAQIYPDNYHAFSFSDERFGLVYKVRSRLEARRVLAATKGLDVRRIVDIGCGDGFHLDLLRTYGDPSWELEGIDIDPRAIKAARERGLTVHDGTVESLDLPPASFDVAFMIQTIEHVADPPAVLRATRELLRPGGRLMLVTDNTGSLDFRLFRTRHWGGYHFPRQWNLFNASSMRAIAAKTGFEVESLETMVSPVNWTYSVRNLLDDWGANRKLVDQFSLEAAPALAVFTAFDALHTAAGRGALLRVMLRRPQ
jgi:2-polyprenyl-3-methyl-5-hydroxy-6-metoxy-1,4-benzoquinol methylase